MFAHYSLVSALAGAVGALASATPDFLATAGLDQLTGVKAMFVVYAPSGATWRIPVTKPENRSGTASYRERVAQRATKPYDPRRD
jgi:hypothetical protein